MLRLKKIFVLILLNISFVSYAMNKSKEMYSPSPTMLAHNKHYFEVLLPKAAFGKKEQSTQSANLQHGGNYIAIPNKRFGRGSSGNNAKL